MQHLLFFCLLIEKQIREEIINPNTNNSKIRKTRLVITEIVKRLVSIANEKMKIKNKC